MPRWVACLCAAVAVLSSDTWEDALDPKAVSPVNDNFEYMLEAGDDRGPRGVVVMLNANPSFFDRCTQCREVDAHYTVFFESWLSALERAIKAEKRARAAAAKAGDGDDAAAREAAVHAAAAEKRPLDGVRFASVEASQKTVQLFQRKGYAVPSVMFLPQGVSVWGGVRPFGAPPAEPQAEERSRSRSRSRAAEDEDEDEDATATTSDNAEPGYVPRDIVPAPQGRRERRRWALMSHDELRDAVGAANSSLNLASLGEWVAAHTGARWPLTDAHDEKLTALLTPSAAAAGSTSGVGFSVKQAMVFVVGTLCLMGCIARMFFAPCDDHNADPVQAFARAYGWWVLFLAHMIFMGGLYWCVLNGAAPLGMNPRGGVALFMSGRRGQYLIEGMFIAALLGAGGYGLLALHRPKEVMHSFWEYGQYLDELKAASARDLTRTVLMGVFFACMLTSLSFLHKSYWYLNGTIFRGATLSIEGIAAIAGVVYVVYQCLSHDLPLIAAAERAAGRPRATRAA